MEDVFGTLLEEGGHGGGVCGGREFLLSVSGTDGVIVYIMRNGVDYEDVVESKYNYNCKEVLLLRTSNVFPWWRAAEYLRRIPISGDSSLRFERGRLPASSSSDKDSPGQPSSPQHSPPCPQQRQE